MQQRNKKSNSVRLLAAASTLALAGFGSAAHAEWTYGIGGALSGQDWDGDMTVGTSQGDLDLEVDLDASDIQDAIDTVYGLGGFATDGTWIVRGSFGVMELEGDGSNGATRGEIEFDRGQAEVIVSYPLTDSDGLQFRVLGGFAYTSHDFELSITNGDASLATDQDGDWIDLVLGVSMVVPFADTWSWDTTVRGEGGDSEGVVGVSTGLGWRFADNWLASATLKYRAAEYESGDEGDADYYYYDVDEASLGLGVMYLF